MRTRSKIRAKCIEAIKNNPGILRSELYSMNIGHRANIGLQVSKLVYERSVVRVWDDVMGTWKLYPRGKQPEYDPHDNIIYKKSLASQQKSLIPKNAHNDKFFMAFDEAFGILYIDLKILGMAAQEMMRERGYRWVL